MIEDITLARGQGAGRWLSMRCFDSAGSIYVSRTKRRIKVYEAARAGKSRRWSGHTRNWSLPQSVWRNPEKAARSQAQAA